jgi:hypothetical protein
MAESNEYTVDRSTWGKGPWDSEPDDKVVWIEPTTDLDCMILRNPMGAWCGYVGLPPNHPHHGKACNDIDYDIYNVHGGLTYAKECAGNICHVPEPGRPHDVWWLGFDCNHSQDRAPEFFGGYDWGEYRTQSYVVVEVTRLALQAWSSR